MCKTVTALKRDISKRLRSSKASLAAALLKACTLQCTGDEHLQEDALLNDETQCILDSSSRPQEGRATRILDADT